MANSQRQRPARRTELEIDPDDFEPVELISKPASEIEKVLLFRLDDVEYHIPKRVRHNVTLQALDVLAERGEAAATAFMLRQLLGDDGYEALINFDDLEEDDFDRICTIARRIVLGPTEGKARRR